MKGFEPYAYVMLRIVSGFMFFWHGLQKFFDVPAGGHVATDTIGYLGATIESFGGLAIMFGLFTRPAAFLASGMMAVAYWQEHGLRSGQPLPIQNRGELAVLFCFVFLFIWTRGGGKLSLDKAREDKKRQ